jgi:hypothetical protein
VCVCVCVNYIIHLQMFNRYTEVSLKAHTSNHYRAGPLLDCYNTDRIMTPNINGFLSHRSGNVQPTKSLHAQILIYIPIQATYSAVQLCCTVPLYLHPSFTPSLPPSLPRLQLPLSLTLSFPLLPPSLPRSLQLWCIV